MNGNLADYTRSIVPARMRKGRGLGSPAVSRQDLLKVVNEDLAEAHKSGRRLSALRLWAEQNLFVFCVYVLDLHYINTDFGYRLCWEVQRRKYGRCWIIAREHFKSTVITFASTLWEICKDPEKTYCIYSYKADIASDFLCQIKDEIERNDLLRYIWSDVFWSDPTRRYEDLPDGKRVSWTWTTTAITVKRKTTCKECTVESSGLVSGQKTGYHFSRLIFDDAETIDSVRTADSIELLKNAFSMAMNTGQTENQDYVIVGTYYALNDLYIHVEKQGIAELVLQPCFWDDGTPSRFTLDQLEQKRKIMGAATFAVQMLCNPKEGSNYTFREEWLQYWSAQEWQGMNVYIFVDPAGKVARKRDYTAIWVVGIDCNANFMVLDVVRDKLMPAQKAVVLRQLVRQYRPRQVYYEQVGLAGDKDYLELDMDRTGFHYGITAVNATVEKGMRIDALASVFEDMRVFLPRQAVHKNWEGKLEDMLESFIEDEYKCYPATTHDDALDSLAMMVPLFLAGTLVVPKMEDQDRRLRRHYGLDEPRDEVYDSMSIV